MVLICVLSFAEKFLNCDVKSVVYGKVNFTGENISNPELYDVTSLYYLNNLTSSMVAKDSKKPEKLWTNSLHYRKQNGKQKVQRRI